jgi:Zn-dependent protease
VDDILVSMAGPAMNLVLAVALMALARAGLLFHAGQLTDLCVQWRR